MFPFPYTRAATAAERNRLRDERVEAAVGKAIESLEDMLAELRILQTGMKDPSWLDMQGDGSDYHRAEYVGRQLDAAAHGLRRYYESVVLAATTAGGYEREPEAQP